MKFSNMKKVYVSLGILIFLVISIIIAKNYPTKDVKNSTVVRLESLDNSTLKERYKISINETIKPGQTFTIYPSDDAFIPYNNLGYLIYDLSWNQGLSLTINRMYDGRINASTYSEGKLYFNDNLGKEWNVPGGYITNISFTNNSNELLKLEGTILLQSMES